MDLEQEIKELKVRNECHSCVIIVIVLVFGSFMYAILKCNSPCNIIPK